MRKSMIGGLAAWLLPVVCLAAPPATSPLERGWLGAYLEGAPPASSEEKDSGVGVGGVVEDSPAEAAGLRASDRILAVDGKPVRTTDETIAAIRGLPPDSWISLQIRRGDDPLDLKVRLGNAPSDRARLRLARGWIGAEAIDLPSSLRELFGAPPDRGVMVSEVLEGSPAEAAGLDIGDVIYEIGGSPVRSAGELPHLVSGKGIGNKIEIEIARSGKGITLEAVVEKEPKEGE
jgi:S1-C subfamily serine protease